MQKRLTNLEFLAAMADGHVGNLPDAWLWKVKGPGGSEPPVNPGVYQKASNLRLFCITTQSATAEFYACRMSIEEAKMRLMDSFEQGVWDDCAQICPSETLAEYHKFFKRLPEFPEYTQDMDKDDPWL